jgi:hypothetical protein
MEGTISLGIYDSDGKLVRVLHREASADEFVAALDGFITFWDGMDDAGHPLPPGHYSARGYMVGAVTVRKGPPATAGSSAAPPAFSTPFPLSPSTHTGLINTNVTFGTTFVTQAKIRVSLVGNPLDRDRAGGAELSVGFDASGSWLKLADGLPLKRISTTPNLKWAVLGQFTRGGPLTVVQSSAVPSGQNVGPVQFVFQGALPLIEKYTITGISNMMAFDCGDFDLPGTSN